MLAELLTELGHRTQRRGRARTLRRAQRPQIHRGDRSAHRRRSFRPNSTSGARQRAAARFARALLPSPARSSSSSRCRQNCRGRSLRRARRAGYAAHLDHLGLAEAFGDHIYSGREHVERGKPAPDLYLHAARQTRRRRSTDCVILEDSRVGATGALASGARVIGLAAGSHCLDGHAEMLRALGVERYRATASTRSRRLLGSRLGARSSCAWSRDNRRCAGWRACGARTRSTTLIPAASSPATLSGLLVSSRTSSIPSARSIAAAWRIVALVVGEAEPAVGVDRVEPAILQRIGAQLVGEADARALPGAGRAGRRRRPRR